MDGMASVDSPLRRVIPLKMSGLRCGNGARRIVAVRDPCHPAQNERAPLRQYVWDRRPPPPQAVIPLKMSGLRCGETIAVSAAVPIAGSSRSK